MTKREWLISHGYTVDKMVRDVYIRPLPDYDMSIGIALWGKTNLEPQAFMRFDYKSLTNVTKKDYEKIGKALNIAEFELKQMLKELGL